ncbi:MAG: aminotransferase class V-fold PLP-dependent enzyme [Gemmatimonadales bacterium]
MPLWTDIATEIADFRRRIRDLPVIPDATPGSLRAELEPRYRFDRSIDLETLTADVMRLLRTQQLHVTHPRYFGLFNPQVREAGIVADTLAALYNAQLAVWSHSPAANEMERLALRALAVRIGYDPDGMLAQFTSGGAEANLCSALCALAFQFPNWADGGVAALGTRPAIYVSGESHHSFVKIAKMTGLGTASVREAPVRADLKLDPVALEQLIEADRIAGWSPLLIVGTAGTTAAGIIDPLPELADVARRTGAWFHVDAAWGGGALMSDTLRPHLEGIATADSVTWDAHKWLSVPMGGGMFFCRHPDAVKQAFAAVHTYMPVPTGDTVDGFQTTPQWSRRATGLKVFMSLAELGIEGYGTLVDHQAAMGQLLRDKLTAADWTLVADTPLPVVCFTHPDIEAGRLSIDDVVQRVYASRQAWISPVILGGHTRALRACITSYETEPKDLDVLIEELEQSRVDR